MQFNADEIAAERPADKLFVYRTAASAPETVTGARLSIDVRSGSLCILTDGQVAVVYAPGQWATVGTRPNAIPRPAR